MLTYVTFLSNLSNLLLTSVYFNLSHVHSIRSLQQKKYVALEVLSSPVCRGGGLGAWTWILMELCRSLEGPCAVSLQPFSNPSHVCALSCGSRPLMDVWMAG